MIPPFRRTSASFLVFACAIVLGPRGGAAQEAAVAQAPAALAASPQTTIQFPRPVPMGSSCGNWQSSPFIYTGTCGLRVRFFQWPEIAAILSNNHVLGAQGPSLCPGTATPLQTLTLQPGTLDIGSIPANPAPYAVGAYLGAMPIDFAPGASNYLDAAVSYTTTGLSDSAILNLGQPTQAITNPVPGMVVTKTGRTTNTTVATIQAVNATVLVGYGTDCGTARFVGQIVITPGSFSAGGDSGAAILQQSTNIPVGLLFAGSPLNTLANDIRLAYYFLGVYPDGVAPAASTMSLDALRRQVLTSGDPEIARVSAIKSRAEASFFRDPEVVGVGVGRDESGAATIVVYTRGPAAPAAQRLPAQAEGVPVRIIRSGPFDAYRW